MGRQTMTNMTGNLSSRNVGRKRWAGPTLLLSNAG